MKTMSVSVTEEQFAAVQQKVKAGQFGNSSEVIRDALRAAEEREIQKDLEFLASVTKDSPGRDPTAAEMEMILSAQKKARVRLKANAARRD